MVTEIINNGEKTITIQQYLDYREQKQKEYAVKFAEEQGEMWQMMWSFKTITNNNKWKLATIGELAVIL